MALPAYETIDLALDDDGLARVTLNQPEIGNPINAAFSRDFRSLTAWLSVEPRVRAILLSANGRFFSVGGDVRAFEKNLDDMPRLVLEWTADLHMAVSRFSSLTAPVVAAVQGNVAGGSVALMAFADVVLAAETAKFSAAFAMLGFCADSGSTVSLAERMGVARAKRFLLLSETLTVPEAQAAGLVDFVHPQDDLAEAALATARKLAAGPTLAFGGIRATMAGVSRSQLEVQLEAEAKALSRLSGSQDAREGITAFMAKRAPRFSGH